LKPNVTADGERWEKMILSVINLMAELAKLKMMRGRTPQSTRADGEGTAASLVPHRDGHLFISKFAGKGGWERHPLGTV
jgi:hypothetical protein